MNNRNVTSSWTNKVKNIFHSCGLHSVFDDEITFPLKMTLENIKEKFKIDQADYLKHECMQQSKLRTLNNFKHFGSTLAYVIKPMSFYQRQAGAELCQAQASLS